MQFSETITMALSSLGANKLRSALTMLGITIGVFSVISVMTAIGALQYSIENGISFLGSNIFQFAKYPANVSAGGNVKKKYQNRRNITYQQALHYQKLMEGNAREICLKCFGYEVKGQAVYNGVKTTPNLLIVGANRGFLTANAYTLGYGRNINDEDVDLARNVIVVYISSVTERISVGRQETSVCADNEEIRRRLYSVINRLAFYFVAETFQADFPCICFH